MGNIMLKSIKFSNFFSYNEENTVAFEVGKAAPKNNMFYQVNKDIRLSKIMTVIGANASGKTNFFKLLFFIKNFIIDSNIDKLRFPIATFFFGLNQMPPISKIELELYIGKILYKYILWVRLDSVVIKEELKYKTPGIRLTSLIKRSISDDVKVKIGECDLKEKINTLLGSSDMNPKASILATFPHIKSGYVELFINYWNNFFTDINPSYPILFDKEDSKDAYRKIAKLFLKDKSFKNKAMELLHSLDLGLDEINVKKTKIENEEYYQIMGVHFIDNLKFELPWLLESEGTRRVFSLLDKILLALNYGGLLVLDELDVNLHPDLLIPIIDRFADPETNPECAQLIFSTHSPLVMNKLDKTQILLVEKNDKKESEIWRLSDMEGIRHDDNWYKKYISGVYGAKPRI